MLGRSIWQIYEGRLRESVMGINPYVVLIAIITVLIAVPVGTWAGPDTCITCHTDAEQLKTLVKPPEIGGEGEG